MTKLEKLTGLIPFKVLGQLDSIKEANTELRIAHFLSQVGIESGNFEHLSENLNYSRDGLLKTFPTHFNASQAMQYQRDAVRIGSRAYANRMGNGNEFSQDGYRYRGRGYLQITGKNNYAAFSKFCNQDCVKDPDLLIREYPLLSAEWFFTENNVWAIADKGSKEANITAVTKLVNGGVNGLDSRIALFNKIYKALS